MSRAVKRAAVIITVIMLVFATQISSFAAPGPIYKYFSKDVRDITGIATVTGWAPKGDLQIPANATGIKSGAFKNSKFPYIKLSGVSRVIIPESVKYIESNAFTSDCSGLKEAVIQNSKSNIRVANDAFPSGTKVVYTVEDVTEPVKPETTRPATTKPAPVKPTSAKPVPARPAPARPAPARPHTTKKQIAPARSSKAEKAEETTTQPTTVVEEITEAQTPLADAAKASQDKELEMWNKLINSNEQAESSEVKPADKSSANGKIAKYATNTAIVIVIFSGAILTYFKFKK